MSSRDRTFGNADARDDGGSGRAEESAIRSGVAMLVLVVAAGTVIARTSAATDAPPAALVPHETFSVNYVVEIGPHRAPSAHVRWELAGVDEIERIRLAFDPDRFTDFSGSGTLERRRGEILWWPGGPYGHLTYTANVDHRRAPNKGYDSYIAPDWVVTRTSALFPRSSVLFRRDVEPQPESRARLTFRLPKGWDAVTVMPSDGERSFVVETPRSRFDHPRGWVMLGRYRRSDATLDSTALTIAGTSDVGLQPSHIVRFLQPALPLLRGILGRLPDRVLIVTAPDPMWRGGLSGEESFYMHAGRPLRTPDKTSPYLHELFHVVAPFRPAADARWVTEGLAEFYSLEIQHRTGAVNDSAYARALDLFARHGLWGEDFTRSHKAAVRNNSAPLLMYALDKRIRGVTAGAHTLDEVVADLARDGGRVSTARFLGAIQRVSGQTFQAFFRRHVYRGEEPVLGHLE